MGLSWIPPSVKKQNARGYVTQSEPHWGPGCAGDAGWALCALAGLFFFSGGGRVFLFKDASSVFFFKRYMNSNTSVQIASIASIFLCALGRGRDLGGSGDGRAPPRPLLRQVQSGAARSAPWHLTSWN